MDTYPMGVRYFNRLMWHGGCSTIHLPMLRMVLGMACLDERHGYAARLSPLLALWQGSPMSLRRETTTRPVRHHIPS